jgi:hypothetical protein
MSEWPWADYVLRHLVAMSRTWEPIPGRPDQSLGGILEFSLSLGMDDGYAHARVTMVDERWEMVAGRWATVDRLRVLVASEGVGLGEPRPALPRYLESGPAVSSERAARNRDLATYLLDRAGGDPGSLRQEDNGSVSFTIARGSGDGAAGS